MTVTANSRDDTTSDALALEAMKEAKRLAISRARRSSVNWFAALYLLALWLVFIVRIVGAGAAGAPLLPGPINPAVTAASIVPALLGAVGLYWTVVTPYVSVAAARPIGLAIALSAMAGSVVLLLAAL